MAEKDYSDDSLEYSFDDDHQKELIEPLIKEKPEEILNIINDKIDIGGGFYLLTEEEELQLSDAEFMTYDLQRNKYKETHGGVLPKLEKKVKPHNPDDDIDITGIPYYLAYFQHAFELEPQYKRMYFNEGHVPEDLRKQFKYKKKDIPAYQKLFRLLKTYDERKQQQMIDSVKGDVGENKSQEPYLQ